MVSFPEAGKITAEFFTDVIYPHFGAPRGEVIVGPGHGVDVAVIRLQNGQAMAVTSDPLSLVPSLGLKESAWLSVHLMASDIATTGFPPMYALFNFTLPPNLPVSDFHVYWKHISDLCEEMNVAIVGGHTGRFEGQNATVVGGGMMMTTGPEKDIITSRGGRPGDTILVTRECAIVSTAILALSFPETIRHACGEEILKKGQDLFYQSSSVSTALKAAGVGRGADGITAMHDVTEGGVYAAIIELATASGCGAIVRGDLIPVGRVQRKICHYFDLNPFVSIGAGSLIIAAAPSKADDMICELAAEDIKASVVGELVEEAQGITIEQDGQSKPMIHPGVDPYWQAFGRAYQAGWK